MRRMKICAALLLTAALLLSGCSGNGNQSRETLKAPETSEGQETQTAAKTEAGAETKAAAEGPITFTDMNGREITLEKPADRIVALTASDCEILYALGAGDRLVGRGEYCNWPEEVLDVPSVQSGENTNVEQIIALQPQVLLMSAMAQTDEQIEALENVGIQVVVSYAQDIEGVYEAISMIGTAMGKNDEADTLITEMKDTFAQIQENSTGDGSETIYFEVSPLEYGLWAAGSDTFMDEVARMLGLTNVFADMEGWGEVSEEQVIQRAPDYIVTIAMYYGEGQTPVEEITSRSGWENIPAIKNGKLLNLQNDELSRPGPRLKDGAEMLYDFVYGAKSENQ